MSSLRTPQPLESTENRLFQLHQRFQQTMNGTHQHPKMIDVKRRLKLKQARLKSEQAKRFWDNIELRIETMCNNSDVLDLISFPSLFKGATGLPTYGRTNHGVWTELLGGENPEWVELQKNVFLAPQRFIQRMEVDPDHLTAYWPYYDADCKGKDSSKVPLSDQETSLSNKKNKTHGKYTQFYDNRTNIDYKNYNKPPIVAPPPIYANTAYAQPPLKKRRLNHNENNYVSNTNIGYQNPMQPINNNNKNNFCMNKFGNNNYHFNDKNPPTKTPALNEYNNYNFNDNNNYTNPASDTPLIEYNNCNYNNEIIKLTNTPSVKPSYSALTEYNQQLIKAPKAAGTSFKQKSKKQGSNDKFGPLKNTVKALITDHKYNLTNVGNRHSVLIGCPMIQLIKNEEIINFEMSGTNIKTLITDIFDVECKKIYLGNAQTLKQVKRDKLTGLYCVNNDLINIIKPQLFDCNKGILREIMKAKMNALNDDIHSDNDDDIDLDNDNSVGLGYGDVSEPKQNATNKLSSLSVEQIEEYLKKRKAQIN